MATDLDGWAAQILDDYEVLRGYPLAEEWQRRHGPPAQGHRLVPKIPFFGGGAFEAGNLYAIDAVKGMRARGSVAVRIRDLPDGATIRFKVVDQETARAPEPGP